ncbi:MAG TPA: DUF5317 domain-containing protein [Actinomycetota bacterium]|nr:DUF5317 domain-containing protein [Actinomycetota bacterium]
MLLALALLVLGILAGLARGGHLENVSAAQFRLPGLVFAGLGLQIGAQALASSVPALYRGWAGTAVLMVSYGLIIAFVVANLRYPGTAFIGAGLALNIVVILANGAMPVSLAAVHHLGLKALPGLQTGVKHHAMTRSTRLSFLGDIIPIPYLGIVSVGDVTLGTGVFLLVQRLVGYQPRRLSGNPPPGRHGVEHAAHAAPSGEALDPPSGSR